MGHPMSTKLQGWSMTGRVDGHTAELLCEAAAELDRLHAIVERLPKTADGVPVVPGVDSVFDGTPNTNHCRGGATTTPDRSRLLPLRVLTSGYDLPFVDGGVDWKNAYSTAEAARAAAEAAREADARREVDGV